MLSIIILGQRPVDVHAHGRPTAAMPPVHATATACVRARARGPTFCALLGLDVGCQRLQLRIASIIRPWWARAPGARARTRPGWRALAITSDSWHRAPPSECIALRAGSARALGIVGTGSTAAGTDALTSAMRSALCLASSYAHA